MALSSSIGAEVCLQARWPVALCASKDRYCPGRFQRWHLPRCRRWCAPAATTSARLPLHVVQGALSSWAISSRPPMPRSNRLWPRPRHSAACPDGAHHRPAGTAAPTTLAAHTASTIRLTVVGLAGALEPPGRRCLHRSWRSAQRLRPAAWTAPGPCLAPPVSSLWVVVCRPERLPRSSAVGSPMRSSVWLKVHAPCPAGAWGAIRPAAGWRLGAAMRSCFLKGGPVAFAGALSCRSSTFSNSHPAPEVLQHGGGFMRVALPPPGFHYRKCLVQLLYAEQGRTHQQQQPPERRGELETELHGSPNKKVDLLLRICFRPSPTSPRMT